MDEINIGFIGLGNMGQHMCLALIQNSSKVTVNDINRQAALPALELGAGWADNPKEVAQKLRDMKADKDIKNINAFATKAAIIKTSEE